MPNFSCKPAWPSTARLAVGVLLAVGEVTVCWGALHPHVDAEYRAHFISKPASCWIPSRLRGAVRLQAPRGNFVVKDLVWPQSCAILRAGWMLENWGAWSIGPVAILRLRVGPATRAVVLGLSAPGYLAHDQALAIATASGKTLIETTIPPDGRTSVTIEVNGVTAADGWVDLHLKISDPRSPASFGVSADDRPLGVGLLSVQLVND